MSPLSSSQNFLCPSGSELVGCFLYSYTSKVGQQLEGGKKMSSIYNFFPLTCIECQLIYLISTSLLHSIMIEFLEVVISLFTVQRCKASFLGQRPDSPFLNCNLYISCLPFEPESSFWWLSPSINYKENTGQNQAKRTSHCSTSLGRRHQGLWVLSSGFVLLFLCACFRETLQFDGKMANKQFSYFWVEGNMRT